MRFFNKNDVEIKKDIRYGCMFQECDQHLRARGR